jgi:hypothetical protein
VSSLCVWLNHRSEVDAQRFLIATFIVLW